MDSLSEYMNRDHIKLLKLLNDVEESFLSGDLDFDKKASAFLDNFRKHVEIEEEILYGPYITKGGLKEVSLRIISEHSQLSIATHKLTVKINLNKNFFGNFISGLKEHVKYEDKFFYPHLEKVLSEDALADYLEKIKETLV